MSTSIEWFSKSSGRRAPALARLLMFHVATVSVIIGPSLGATHDAPFPRISPYSASVSHWVMAFSNSGLLKKAWNRSALAS